MKKDLNKTTKKQLKGNNAYKKLLNLDTYEKLRNQN